jgi:phosphate transport system permease protein
MQLSTRKVIDRSFTGLGIVSIVIVTCALVVFLFPIFSRGLGAFFFRATVEHRQVIYEQFGRGNADKLSREIERTNQARQPVYEMMAAFEQQMEEDRQLRREYRRPFKELEKRVEDLLGPAPGEPEPILIRDQYGQTRWDRAQVKLHSALYRLTYDYSDPSGLGKEVYTPRREEFQGTSLEPLFGYLEQHADNMLNPRWTFYWRFLFDKSIDAHIFGGIWPEVLGTLYLTLGAILFAVPTGVISAIYLVEYAGEGRFISLLRTCISTLAGVPSIVFGLFGLAFFINTIHVSGSKSVFAGSLTLALLILPVVIRASEEAIRAVPLTYKEAALSLGAGKWRTIVTVILPAALPGVLTGIVISMGRAAGETAPIIFTAAVSMGQPLGLFDVFSEPTPALPWNVYNLCTEHEAVDEIRHVQYGMVLTLVGLVLLLNLAAIVLRARVSQKLKG